jgi:uncharacterized protein (DUF2062 family)
MPADASVAARTVGGVFETNSMTHDVTWAVLLDGLFGGLIGTLGAFGAAAMAILYDRRQRQRQEDQRAAEEREKRRRRAAASLTDLLRTLDTEVRWAPFLAGRTVLALSSAMLVFEAEIGADHPQVSRWLTDRYGELIPEMQAWRRVWWLPPARKRHLRPVAHNLAQLSATLTAWSTGRVSDVEVAATRISQKPS